MIPSILGWLFQGFERPEVQNYFSHSLISNLSCRLSLLQRDIIPKEKIRWHRKYFVRCLLNTCQSTCLTLFDYIWIFKVLKDHFLYLWADVTSIEAPFSTLSLLFSERISNTILYSLTEIVPLF